MCSMSRIHRTGAASTRGFTLIELLVSIAIMAVLTAIILPAVQQTRERMRAVQSRSNLAQLGQAFHAYHLSQGMLPAGSVDAQSPVQATADRFVWGWGMQLLPYLDEANRYAALDPARGVFDPKNSVTLASTPPVFACPLSTPKNALGYAACYHDWPSDVTDQNRGIFYLNSRVRFDDLVDGTQYSLFVGEASQVRWAEGTHGSLRSTGPVFDPATVRPLTPEEQAARRELNQKNAEEVERLRTQSEAPPEDAAYAPWDDSMGAGVSPEYFENGDAPPPPPETIPLKRTGPPRQYAPVRSTGTQFLLGDGSVRAISRSIDPNILRRLANRLDHWTTGEF